MTLSCEQCVDIVAIAIEIQNNCVKTLYGQRVDDVIERDGSFVHYSIDEEGLVSIHRVFAQNQESRKLADLLTDYFNESK